MSRVRAAIIEVSDGNVRNSHFYLREVLSMFRASCVGGSNLNERARKLITLIYPGERVETDIDGEKKFFRDRGSVKRFYENSGVVGGDLIMIEKIGDFEFEITKASKRGFKYYL